MKRFLFTSLVVATTLLILLFPMEAVNYARSSLALCTDTVIPSLFPFFVCSGLLIYSGFCQTLSALAKPVMKPFFNVNENGAGAFLLGIISGYPLGAVTACQLYESGYLSKYEAERLLAFCNNSGPLFILGAMGICMYHDRRVGFMLYFAHLLSALTVGILFRFYKKNRHVAPGSTIGHSQKDLSGIYSTVLQNSINSILTICGSIVFFGMISALITSILPFNSQVKAICMSLLEMTGGVNMISLLEADLTKKLILSAIATGFAGFCVHLQVLSVVSRFNLSMIPYIFGKILHGIFSGVYMYAILKLFPISAPAFAGGTSPSYTFFTASALVCITVLFFVLITFFPRKKVL